MNTLVVGPGSPQPGWVVRNGRALTGRGVQTVEHLIFRPGTRVIGPSLCEGWTHLKTVTLPDGLSYIGSNAFAGCTTLRTIKLPSTLECIQCKAFQLCHNLQRVSFPEGLRVIGVGAFEACSSLRSVHFPGSIRYIMSNAFHRCSGLRSIVFAESGDAFRVASVGSGAFRWCTNVQHVALSKHVKAIPHGTFASCYSLQFVDFPEGLAGICEHAFYDCRCLQHVIMPETLTDLHQLAFADCANWHTFVVRPSGEPAMGPGSNQWANVPDPTCVWAPDLVVAQLGGPFAAYTRFAEVPPALRAASWATVELGRWWAPVGGKHRLSAEQMKREFTVMAVDARFRKQVEVNLPREIWRVVLAFVMRDTALPFPPLPPLLPI